jgi:thiamine kinase-like enzyme
MTDTEKRIQALPLWAGELSIAPLKGGLSNESFIVTDDTGEHVVRFGQDFPVHHVSRDHEAMVSRAAFEAGFAPELEHYEPGAMVFRFIEGKTYDVPDVQANIARLAEMVRSYHQTMPRYVTGAARLFWVFHVIRDYAHTLKIGKSRMTDNLPGYLALAEELESVQVPLPIVYGHHDLLPANFIDDGEKIWLIDFEYAAYGTAMFDLAGIASNALFDADQDEELLALYFDRRPDVDLSRSFAGMKCASLLREAMWSMVSEIHLEAPGVDYEAYTAENLERLDAVLAHYRSQYL